MAVMESGATVAASRSSAAAVALDIINLKYFNHCGVWASEHNIAAHHAMVAPQSPRSPPAPSSSISSGSLPPLLFLWSTAADQQMGRLPRRSTAHPEYSRPQSSWSPLPACPVQRERRKGEGGGDFSMDWVACY
jgi:hypothetical protein